MSENVLRRISHLHQDSMVNRVMLDFLFEFQIYLNYDDDIDQKENFIRHLTVSCSRSDGPII